MFVVYLYWVVLLVGARGEIAFSLNFIKQLLTNKIVGAIH